MNRTFAKLFRQKQALFKLIASFLTMLVIPLFLVMANYLYARSLLQQENLDYQNAVLCQVQLGVDERLQSLQLFTLDLANDTMLNQALTQVIPNREEANLQLWRASNHLTQYSASMGNLCDVTVYSKGYDCIIHSNYVDYRASQGIHRLETPELNQLMLDSVQQSRAYCRFNLLKDSLGNQKLVLLHSVPLWSTGQNSFGTICLTIKTGTLFTSVTEMEEWDAGIVCLVNELGQPVAWYGDDTLLESLETVLASEESFQKINGISHTVSRGDSKITGWHYISIQPEHVMTGKLRSARNASLMMLAAVLFVGVGIAFILVRRNYKPLEQLMAELRRQSLLLKSGGSEQGDEYHLIERSIMDMADSMSTLQATLQEEMPRIQESVITQLFHNAVTDYETYRNNLEQVGILLPFQRFRVAVIRQIQYSEVKDQALAGMMFKELLSQMLPPNIIYTFATAEQEALVLLLNGDGEDFEQETRRLLDATEQAMRETYDQLFWICVSEVGIGMESVSAAYYSVVQAQPQSPSGGIRYLSEYGENRSIDKSMEGITAQMQNYVSTGNADGAISLLHQRLEQNLLHSRAELYEIRAYCIGILYVIVGAYRVENPKVLLVDGKPPLKMLFYYHNVEDMEILLSTLIRQICSYVQENQNSPTSRLTQQILDYVRENFTDVDLTLTSVSDHFNLTSSYLSVFFKNNVGDTFLNYLTRLRMDRAKELMRTTNLTINEISDQVGYGSANTFTRAFKKIEQITPSQYRDSACSV